MSSVTGIKGWFKALAVWALIDCRTESKLTAFGGGGQAVVSDVTGWPNWPMTGGTYAVCGCSRQVKDCSSVSDFPVLPSRDPSRSTLALRYYTKQIQVSLERWDGEQWIVKIFITVHGLTYVARAVLKGGGVVAPFKSLPTQLAIWLPQTQVRIKQKCCLSCNPISSAPHFCRVVLLLTP